MWAESERQQRLMLQLPARFGERPAIPPSTYLDSLRRRRAGRNCLGTVYNRRLFGGIFPWKNKSRRL